MTIKVYVDMSVLRDYQMKAAMKFMWRGFGFFLGLIALVVVVGSASAAVPPPDPDPLTFTKFIQLMKIEHKIEPGVHRIYLTWRQKETTKKIYFPMFSPNVLCGIFDDLAGQTVIVAAVGETDVEYTCERTN